MRWPRLWKGKMAFLAHLFMKIMEIRRKGRWMVIGCMWGGKWRKIMENEENRSLIHQKALEDQLVTFGSSSFGVLSLFSLSHTLEASMLVCDSHLSTRPLCSNSLFIPIDYIFMLCLTKWFSWLVVVQPSSYSSNYFCTIISLLYFCSEDVIILWVVTLDLGVKKWLKS